jgi:RHS repeat-associated protein
VVANASGGIENESDYYPYGGEMVITQTLANQNYKFTGKERDSESNLDNFGARYYGSSLGRFMTPDWAARPTAVPYAVFGDPQSLNLYGYVRNDPVSAVDADGHLCMNGHDCDPDKTAAGQTKTDTAQNPLASITVLGSKVGITYSKALSTEEKIAAGNSIAAAAALINKNASSLTADEKKAIGQISSFTVVASGLLGATGKHALTLSAAYIRDTSPAWLGSMFGHEGQHHLNAGRYSGANLWRDEQSAGRTQLGIGNKLGFTQNERHSLELWIDEKTERRCSNTWSKDTSISERIRHACLRKLSSADLRFSCLHDSPAPSSVVRHK